MKLQIQPQFSMIEKSKKPLLIPINENNISDTLLRIQIRYHALYKKKKRIPKMNVISKLDKKRLMIANYIDNGLSNYAYIAEQLNM